MSDASPDFEAPVGPSLPQIAWRVLNRPLLLHPSKLDVILHVLQGRLRLDGAGLEGLAPEASRFLGRRHGAEGRAKSYSMADGVAIVSIVGSLVNRGAWIGANSGLVSYEGIAAQLRDAREDPDVEAVVLDIDSPGGEATGMFGLVDQISALNGRKPVVAFVNDVAASAAYGLASAAREIVVSPTSVVGSVGVVFTHVDRSGELEQKGIKVQHIFAGDHKVDGNPFEPLPASVRADLQAEVMQVYDAFVGLVARGRGTLTGAAIRATQARTFIGQDAIDRGLADRIASLDAVLSDLKKPAPGAPSKRTRVNMIEPVEAHPQALKAALTEADLTAAVDKARTEGATEAMARIQGILSCAEAEGREAQARVLAFDTAMGVEAAKTLLVASPKASHVPSIEARDRDENAFGDDGSGGGADVGAQAARGWNAAINQANARLTGAQSPS